MSGTVYKDLDSAPDPGGTLLVLGPGSIGDMATRVAMHRGVEQVIGVDLVPERLARLTGRGGTAIGWSVPLAPPAEPGHDEAVQDVVGSENGPLAQAPAAFAAHAGRGSVRSR
jgi:threonine dehydrogenase-like Zn-dependent dehydrogenase